MSQKLSTEALVSFVDEVKAQLPVLRAGIEELEQGIEQSTTLAQAVQLLAATCETARFADLHSVAKTTELLQSVIEQSQTREHPAGVYASVYVALLDCLETSLDLLATEQCDDSAIGMLAEELYGEIAPANESSSRDEVDWLSAAMEDVDDHVSCAEPTPTAESPKTSVSDESALQDELTADLAEQTDVPADLREVFMEEADDHLKAVYAHLPELAANADHRATLNEIRRSVHTLKGAAGAVGLKVVTRLAHRMEDALDGWCEAHATVTDERMELLYSSTDLLQDLISGQYDPSHVVSRLVENLTGYDRFDNEQPGDSPAAKAKSSPTPVMQQAAPIAVAAPVQPPVSRPVEPAPTMPRATSAPMPAAASPLVRVPLEKLDALAQMAGELLVNGSVFEQYHSRLTQAVAELQATGQRLRKTIHNLDQEYGVATLGADRLLSRNNMTATTTNTKFGAASQTEFDSLEFDRYTDFHILIRSLSEAAGDIQTLWHELNQLGGDCDAYGLRENRLGRKLQEQLMAVRMVPLASLKARLQRTVRTIAGEQRKSIDFELTGEHIEFDKSILDQLSDPLMHLLRNAVDHGVETPERREAAGKPSRAVIRVEAAQQGTFALLKITDDGAGLNREKIRETAIRHGLLAADAADTLADEDLLQYIFQPGFSTAETVSQVSGRGMGMDIVWNNITRLKGAIRVESTPGAGTTFSIRLPMSLATTRALFIAVSGEKFALPMQSVFQIVRLEAEHSIRETNEALQIEIDEEVYPLVRLDAFLELPPSRETDGLKQTVLLLETAHGRLALLVDRVIAGRDIVVKSLGSHLQYVPGLSGVTIEGDGLIVPILDPSAFSVADSRLLPAARSDASATPPAPTPREDDDAPCIMVVDDSVSVRRVTGNLLRKTGWNVLEAKDGLDALDILHGTDQRPDAFLLDVEMPRMDGYELLSSLRTLAEFVDVPVVMVTSRGGEKHRQKAFDLGATDYVVKPYQDDALLALLRQLIGVA